MLLISLLLFFTIFIAYAIGVMNGHQQALGAYLDDRDTSCTDCTCGNNDDNASGIQEVMVSRLAPQGSVWCTVLDGNFAYYGPERNVLRIYDK